MHKLRKDINLFRKRIMIDLRHDELMTFAEVAKRLPPSHGGKHLHVATIHRWRCPGVKRVRLEAVRIGGAWFTSWSAVLLFVERLSDAEPLKQTDVIATAEAACRTAGF